MKIGLKTLKKNFMSLSALVACITVCCTIEATEMCLMEMCVVELIRCSKDLKLYLIVVTTTAQFAAPKGASHILVHL